MTPVEMLVSPDNYRRKRTNVPLSNNVDQFGTAESIAARVQRGTSFAAAAKT